MTTIDEAKQANIKRLDALKSDRKFINKLMWVYFWGTGAAFSMEMMMTPGIVQMVSAAADTLYPGDTEKQKELLRNHTVFFNTQPNMTIVPGTVMGLEIERAKGADIPNDVVQSIKAALAGSFAGIGDTLIQGILVPTLLSIGMGLSSGGSGIGLIFAWLMFFVIMYPVSYYLFRLGLNAGADGAGALLEGDLKDRFINAITILGSIVVGAVLATTANVSLALHLTPNGSDIVVEDMMNSIFPGFTTIVLFMIVYLIMTRKKVGALKMLGIVFLFSIFAYFTGLI